MEITSLPIVRATNHFPTFTSSPKMTPVSANFPGRPGSGNRHRVPATRPLFCSHIAFRVYTIERIYSLYVRTRRLFDQLRYHNIVTRYSDGTTGWKEESPFDAIIVTAGAPEIPAVLVNQLAHRWSNGDSGGRDRHSQDLIKLVRDQQGIHQTNLGGCRFVKLVAVSMAGGICK